MQRTDNLIFYWPSRGQKKIVKAFTIMDKKQRKAGTYVSAVDV